jgi:hypothetical protein
MLIVTIGSTIRYSESMFIEQTWLLLDNGTKKGFAVFIFSPARSPYLSLELLHSFGIAHVMKEFMTRIIHKN